MVGLRSTWDFYRTGLRGRPRYYGSWASFVLGIAGLAATPFGLSLGFVLGAVGVVSSALLLAPEWSGARQGQVLVEHVDDFRVGRLDVGDTATVVRHPITRREAVVVDDQVDRSLLETRAKVAWSPVPTPIPTEVSRHSFDILARRARSTHTVFNGRLIRQDTELTAELLRSDGDVQLSKTDYFSLLCSNYMTEWRLQDRSSEQLIVDGTTLLADRGGRLRSLDQSRLANPIGVSTLALTTDHRMVLVAQHPDAQSSAALFAPAGSGSMDFADRSYARRHSLHELKAMVSYAMRRELCEECAVNPATDLKDTEVLGYFRWLNKGGKPEYTGITGLTLSSEDFAHRTVRRVEMPYVRRIVVCRIDFERLRENPGSLLCVPTEYRRRVSVPLFLCLRRLGTCLQESGAVGDRVRKLTGVTT